MNRHRRGPRLSPGLSGDASTTPPGPSGRPGPGLSGLLVLLIVALASLAACSNRVGTASEADMAQPDDGITATKIEGETAGEGAREGAGEEEPATAADPVPQILAAMTREEKIGQLLMPKVFGSGDNPSPGQRQLNLDAHGYETPSEIVAGYNLGGVIYLDDNIESAPQVRSLSRRLQDASGDATGIGLLVAVDQEGGQVSKLSDEVSLFPSAAVLSGDPQLVLESSYITGQQVQQQGINVVLAPVADVLDPNQESFIGGAGRSFGDDPQVVASMVSSAVEGLQQSGVAAAVKHWPGHGATGVDSHFSLPTVDVDRELWDSRERVPFAAAIEQDVAIVMVGHLAMPGLDPSGRAATVSPVLVDGLLRTELGFDGVVMSDALNMQAVGDIPEVDRAVESVLAGIDVVLMPPSLREAYAGLSGAVADGRITEERLDASVTRVLRLKQHLGLLPA